MLRVILLFAHVIGAMAIFAAIGMEGLALAQLRRAPDQAGARAAFSALRLVGRVGGPGTILLLISGIWLATAFWHWRGAWIGLGFAGLLLVGALGGAVSGRRQAKIRTLLADPRFDATTLRDDSVLRTSFLVRCALLVVIVFLMTVKPG